jgi:hypothetical protein
MAAIPGRAERVLNRGWSAVREHAASPDGSDRLRRLVPAWIDRANGRINRMSRRRGWMTYCLGRERMGVPWELVPAYSLSRLAQPYLFEPIHISYFLSCSEHAPRRRAARRGTLGRTANLSIARNRPLIYREF